MLQNLIVPLRRAGRQVCVCGVNNIPRTIDGDATPADGGRSFFQLDHYESFRQEDIDTSALGIRCRKIVDARNAPDAPRAPI